MNRRDLLNFVAFSSFSMLVLPDSVRRAAWEKAWGLRRVDADECDHGNIKVITQQYMDEDMQRRGDVVCSGEMVFYAPGVYCLDCLTRIGDV